MNCACKPARWTASTPSRTRPVSPKHRSYTSNPTIASIAAPASRFVRLIRFSCWKNSPRNTPASPISTPPTTTSPNPPSRPSVRSRKDTGAAMNADEHGSHKNSSSAFIGVHRRLNVLLRSPRLCVKIHPARFMTRHTPGAPLLLSSKSTLIATHASMKKLLALNRSEIAIRILRAANELGLRTVAVYSKEDRLALHRFKADEAYLIGEGKGPVEAYLDVEGIVALAKEKGVDAIHPGYGFLSENSALPRACERAGIAFVGPSANLLDLLGDKTAARRLARQAGIPRVPGTEEAVTNPKQAAKIAGEIGYPLIDRRR